jgi:hypothetical protein
VYGAVLGACAIFSGEKRRWANPTVSRHPDIGEIEKMTPSTNRSWRRLPRGSSRMVQWLASVRQLMPSMAGYLRSRTETGAAIRSVAPHKTRLTRSRGRADANDKYQRNSDCNHTKL